MAAREHLLVNALWADSGGRAHSAEHQRTSRARRPLSEIVCRLSGGSHHHQPWRLVQRSSRPLMTSITARATMSWTHSVRSLTMTFIP